METKDLPQPPTGKQTYHVTITPVMHLKDGKQAAFYFDLIPLAQKFPNAVRMIIQKVPTKNNRVEVVLELVGEPPKQPTEIEKAGIEVATPRDLETIIKGGGA